MTDKDKEIRNHSWDELFEFLEELKIKYPDPEKSKLIYVLTEDELYNIKAQAKQEGREEMMKAHRKLIDKDMDKELDRLTEGKEKEEWCTQERMEAELAYYIKSRKEKK